MIVLWKAPIWRLIISLIPQEHGVVFIEINEFVHLNAPRVYNPPNRLIPFIGCEVNANTNLNVQREFGVYGNEANYDYYYNRLQQWCL